MINYVNGDATKPIGGGPKFIIHCCNDLGLWGAGFVLAVSRRWPEPEEAYYSLGEDLPLGLAQIVSVEEDLWVVNMVGQHGVGNYGTEPPIRYDAIRRALVDVATACRDTAYRDLYESVAVHAPRFGAGLAGGDWSIIERLINEELVTKGIEVTVYDFAG